MGTVEDLAAAWRRAGSVVVLTGAGMSTASGIADYRSPGGLWERFQAVTIHEFMESALSREGYWGYKTATWKAVQQAEPNPAHAALADLGRAGRIDLLVTQNIDGLHARSGYPESRLVRIHGTDSLAMCLSCDDRRPRRHIQALWDKTGEPPRCTCGGWWKPATISFGMSLVAEDLQRALGAAGGADLLVAAGSSLVVGPINAMVPQAAEAGAQVAILTASETPFDDLATWRSNDPLEEILPRVRDAVLGPET
jgi:NAD-dependent deacetylase